MLYSWISVDPKNNIFKQNFRKFDYLFSIFKIAVGYHGNITLHLNEVYSGYILYVCSCGVWEKHMPSF